MADDEEIAALVVDNGTYRKARPLSFSDVSPLDAPR